MCRNTLLISDLLARHRFLTRPRCTKCYATWILSANATVPPLPGESMAEPAALAASAVVPSVLGRHIAVVPPVVAQPTAMPPAVAAHASVGRPMARPAGGYVLCPLQHLHNVAQKRADTPRFTDLLCDPTKGMWSSTIAVCGLTATAEGQGKKGARKQAAEILLARLELGGA